MYADWRSEICKKQNFIELSETDDFVIMVHGPVSNVVIDQMQQAQRKEKEFTMLGFISFKEL